MGIACIQLVICVGSSRSVRIIDVVWFYNVTWSYCVRITELGKACRWGLWGHEEPSVIKWCPYCRCDDCITLADYILCPYYWALNAVLYVCVPRELSLMERCPYYRCGDCIILGNYNMSTWQIWGLYALLYICGTPVGVRELSVIEKCPYYRGGICLKFGIFVTTQRENCP